MSVSFSAYEILEIAERMERDAAALYEAAATATTHPAARELFTDLANWERQHEEMVGAMRQEESGGVSLVADVDPDSAMGQFLEPLAGQTPFGTTTAPMAAFGHEPTLDHILRVALDREKDAVAFYLGIKEMVGELGKEKVDQVIHAELDHITLLIGMLRQVIT